jgi:hypothetical protein
MLFLDSIDTTMSQLAFEPAVCLICTFSTVGSTTYYFDRSK